MEALATYRTARLVWVRHMPNVKRIGTLAAGLTGIAVIALPAIWTLPVALPRITKFTFTKCAIAAVSVIGIGGTGLPSVVFGTLLGMTGVIRTTILTYFTPNCWSYSR